MEFSLFTEKLFARAREKGLTECEVYSVLGDSFEALLHDGELVQYNVSQNGGLAFRALRDGKMGCASTQILDEEAIEFLIDGAMENAALIENEDEQFLAPAGGEYAQMDGYSPAALAPTAHEKIQLAKELENKAAAKDERVKPQYGYVFSDSSEVKLVNTLGVNLSYRDSSFGFGVETMAREGENVASGGDMDFGRDPAKLDADKIVDHAVKEAVDGLSAQSVATGSYGILLRYDMAASLLGCLSPVFSADMAQKGLSLLKGREGEMIASEKLTLTDDPHHPTAPASRPFDGEGSPTYAKNVVENGRLTTLLHNLKTAKKQGVKTTGNASRPSYTASVGVAPSNFYIQPGSRTLEEMAADMGEGLLITQLAGLHSGVNQISGDFSLGAKGYRIENGKVGRSVKQITVAGNFYQMLKDIVETGCDLKFTGRGIGSPTVWIRNLSVAGE